MHLPRATYRVQFNEHFRLSHAAALVPYWHELGISHLYASPLFKASPHSPHGYDVCDFNQLNPELGTEADLAALARELHARKMGLILDLVPNHMGITSPANAWWWDVLARGQKSRFADHFDIDWMPADKAMRGKVLAPVLGAEFEEVLQRGELRVQQEAGKFVLAYHQHRFPLAPQTTVKLPASEDGLQRFNANQAALEQLLRRQSYRLAFHEHGDERLNYRRFFAVSSLAGVRVEQEKTFAATHALVRRWLEKGWLDGLRVDHPDGLRDPAKYLAALRTLAPDTWIVVEKILETNETLPAWPVQGTTGYDFLNVVNGLGIDAGAEAALTELYATFTGEGADYATLLLEKKRQVLKTLFVAECTRLTGLLTTLAARCAGGGGFSPADMRGALAEVIACFPVYRTYLTGATAPAAADVAVIKAAVHLACEHCHDLPPEVFAFIHALLLKPPRSVLARNFIARFQQLTGAVMAKGAEDTAFYCFNRFASLNEVGGNPARFGLPLADFHAWLQRQKEAWPNSQLTTSTHDTKRSEDVRARLNVLSEIPGEWAQAVGRWSAMNACHREGHFPDRNAEYLFYQALVGAWPLTEARAQAYMEKASHEAKQHTDWTRRNPPYEAALKKFVSETLRDPQFMTDLEHFVGRISEAASVNALAQTLLKLTAPGVPDIYQGCELWDFSLVDPDNRRPVDFALRQNLLETVASASAAEIWRRRADGSPKLWLIRKVLKRRERMPEDARLNYEPVFAQGAKADHVVAFSRGGAMMPVVPRFYLKLNHDWQDTVLPLPDGDWLDEFSGETFRGVVPLPELLRWFPVALLVRKEND